MTSFDENNQSNCHEAQLLMSAYMKGDPVLTQEQREAFEAHLVVCPACQGEYCEDKQLVTLAKKCLGPMRQGTLEPPGKSGHPVSRQEGIPPRCSQPVTVKESWEDLKRRSPSLAEACRRDERKRKLCRFVWRVSGVAAAACILVTIAIGWLTLRSGGSGQQVSGNARLDITGTESDVRAKRDRTELALLRGSTAWAHSLALANHVRLKTEPMVAKDGYASAGPVRPYPDLNTSVDYGRADALIGISQCQSNDHRVSKVTDANRRARRAGRPDGSVCCIDKATANRAGNKPKAIGPAGVDPLCRPYDCTARA